MTVSGEGNFGRAVAVFAGELLFQEGMRGAQTGAEGFLIAGGIVVVQAAVHLVQRVFDFGTAEAGGGQNLGHA